MLKFRHWMTEMCLGPWGIVVWVGRCDAIYKSACRPLCKGGTIEIHLVTNVESIGWFAVKGMEPMVGLCERDFRYVRCWIKETLDCSHNPTARHGQTSISNEASISLLEYQITFSNVAFLKGVVGRVLPETLLVIQNCGGDHFYPWCYSLKKGNVFKVPANLCYISDFAIFQ